MLWRVHPISWWHPGNILEPPSHEGGYSFIFYAGMWWLLIPLLKILTLFLPENWRIFFLLLARRRCPNGFLIQQWFVFSYVQQHVGNIKHHVSGSIHGWLQPQFAAHWRPGATCFCQQITPQLSETRMRELNCENGMLTSYLIFSIEHALGITRTLLNKQVSAEMTLYVFGRGQSTRTWNG